MTDYDLMNQAADWKEVLTQARKEKLLVLEEGKRVRDYVAAVLGEKPTKIAQLEAINNNATEEVKEQFEKGNMKITSAYETSRLSEDAQKEVAAAVEAGADIKSEEIKQMSEEKKRSVRPRGHSQRTKCVRYRHIRGERQMPRNYTP